MTHFGILGAMEEEVALLREHILQPLSTTIGRRTYTTGTIGNHRVTVVFSRWGKVAAASTATTLLDHFKVDTLLFTGVAGAVDPRLQIGDIVIGTDLLQHDMDASALPGIARFEIPLLGVERFQSAPALVEVTCRAAEAWISNALPRDIPPTILQEFGISRPAVHSGLIASGDQFIAHPERTATLAREIPGLLCVEMEGAAVAQVAFEHSTPCLVIRTISDRADHGAPLDFPRFITHLASRFTGGITLRLLDDLARQPLPA